MSTLPAAISQHLERFLANGQLGADPLGELYAERRRSWSLFSTQLSDREIESLRRYIFPYDKLPMKMGDAPVRSVNFVDGSWSAPARGEFAKMTCPADKRLTLAEVAASTDEDVESAIAYGHAQFASMHWADEPLTYREWVAANLSRILLYYYEEVLAEIRAQIPKTRLEADKDFWEGKRACDHLGGTAEKAMLGDLLPTMLPGHTYWKSGYVPAGLCVLLT